MLLRPHRRPSPYWQRRSAQQQAVRNECFFGHPCKLVLFRFLLRDSVPLYYERSVLWGGGEMCVWAPSQICRLCKEPVMESTSGRELLYYNNTPVYDGLWKVHGEYSAVRTST